MSEWETEDVEHSSARLKVFVLVGAIVILLAANVYLLWRVNRLETGTSQWKAATSQQLSELRQAVSAADSAEVKNLETLRSDLADARRQAAVTAGHAKIEAQRHAEQLADKLAQAQQQQQQQVAAELTDIKQGAATTNSKIADVSTDVASTKTELQNTVADLKRMTGDMGVMSGRIATNGQELSALKALGERNYYEFNIAKSKTPQKVANIQIWVKKADAKRNRFTIDMLADDKRVEKKDRTINEPVQFYVAKARQPYELVVNQVTKDRIVGYLATPKVEMARN